MIYSNERIGGVASPTLRIVISDTAKNLKTMIDEAVLPNVIDWNDVNAIQLYVEEHDCRIAFGTTASNGVTPLGGIRYVGQRERIPNYSRIIFASVINAIAGNNAVLMIDIEAKGLY